jgi:hypothetical protein
MALAIPKEQAVVSLSHHSGIFLSVVLKVEFLSTSGDEDRLPVSEVVSANITRAEDRDLLVTTGGQIFLKCFVSAIGVSNDHVKALRNYVFNPLSHRGI